MGGPVLIRNIFRHPYPLPAPPSVPRKDKTIISSHSAAEKNINIKRVDPDDDLSALIDAAGEEHNLVRRSNACGALKVLASKDSNRRKLCRTTGLLDVLVKASWDDAVDSDALDGRTRAVTTIFYLSEPKDNRLIVAKHPQLLEVLVKVIQEDTGEARWRATSALATLAKTPGNRGRMGSVDKLATVLGELMVEDQDFKPQNLYAGSEKGGGGGGGKLKGVVSRDEDDNISRVTTFSDESMSTDGGRTKSFDTMDEDERMLKMAYTGTFSEGTGTTLSEDLMHTSSFHSDAHSDEEGDDGSDGDDDNEDDDDNNKGEGINGDGDKEEDDGSITDAGYDELSDDSSIPSESGVEMQISSLKKLNIEQASNLLAKSQLSACATLTHLTKHCANAMALCHNDELLGNVIFLSCVFDSPLHARCIEMMCNFSRFPSNNARLAGMPLVVETLLLCGKSKINEDRMWAIRTIQNLCSDASSKVGLATHEVLTLLTSAAMRNEYEEQHAAVGALMNVATEPGSLVHIMNTKTVVATLVHLAHSPNTPGAVRMIACDALATIGLWLQTLASTGTMPEEMRFSPLPTHEATGWLRWEVEEEEEEKKEEKGGSEKIKSDDEVSF